MHVDYAILSLSRSQGFPLIFHGVAGTDECNINSTSVYNMAGVEAWMEYLESLFAHLHKKGVEKNKPGEICIISLYRKKSALT